MLFGTMLIACDCFWFVGFWYLAMKYAIIKCQNVIGVLPVSRCLTKIKHSNTQSIPNMPLSNTYKALAS